MLFIFVIYSFFSLLSNFLFKKLLYDIFKKILLKHIIKLDLLSDDITN